MAWYAEMLTFPAISPDPTVPGTVVYFLLGEKIYERGQSLIELREKGGRESVDMPRISARQLGTLQLAVLALPLV
jgi:hypothetical protein